MTIALERPVDTVAPVTLVAPEVMSRLVRRVITDHPEIGAETAHRIVGQAAAFVAASGQQSGWVLVPSKLVSPRCRAGCSGTRPGPSAVGQ
ncbi:hypothetical protein [Streptomyces yerevanensis]|uniref:hypothetical protein n=1 Tax=Streptomyces yerevanensis TaxID=66378 RepID=UPI000524B039|nr:hypothetical protein [Streptomyces yerevanensis]